MNFLRQSLSIVIRCSRLNIIFSCVMFWKLRKKRLQRFILKLMNRWNVKTISWNNIFEHMSISLKIIESFYFSWSNSLTTMRTIFQSICHRSKRTWITVFVWFRKKFKFQISNSNCFESKKNCVNLLSFWKMNS